MKYQASCHCGQTAFEFEGEISEALSCNCSICSRRGSLLWFTPRDALKLLTPENDSIYRFHKHRIAHHFCPNCGIHTYGEGATPDGTPMAAINLRCVEGLDLDALAVKRFDGHTA